MTDITEQARSWAEADPDPETAAALLAMVEAGDTEALQSHMGAALEFGTAGIRGEVGPGSSRMNRAVVIRTTRGLADFLLKREGGTITRPVVIGYDARPTSRTFAEDASGVLAEAGIPVVYFPDVVPTPLAAFAAKHLEAIAAVVVTASHNPPADNGYKVYDSNAAQIIPPTDEQISEAISRVGGARDVPRAERAFRVGHELVQLAPEGILDAYWAEVDSVRPIRPGSTIPIVYTPLHGCGGETLLDVFDRTSHHQITAVPEQVEPDGTFPTVSFPNPEEPGALDYAIGLGDRSGASLVIANDPDADRLAAAVPAGDGWRMLTGNELGAILGGYLLRNWPGPGRAITACSVVSSPMLSAMAAKAGALHLTTLTGFKWIANAGLSAEQAGEGTFLFGYEEALGYTVGRTVRDKDGISAAVILADIAALQNERGRTLLDLLADLWQEHGIWVSTQRSITRRGPGGVEELVHGVGALAAKPPGEVGGLRVEQVTDFRQGASERPWWLGAQDLIELSLGESGRILVRPSGTEPKLKIYVDLATPAGSVDDVHARRDSLRGRAESLAGELSDLVGALIGD